MPIYRLVFIAGIIHLNSFIRLCWDERRVKLSTNDDEQLWRLVYRRSGMGRLEFKQAQKLGRHDALPQFWYACRPEIHAGKRGCHCHLKSTLLIEQVAEV